MGKKLTLEEFIKRARIIHGNKYDYSKVEYNGMFNKGRMNLKEQIIMIP